MQYKSRKGIPIFMHVLKNKDLLRGTVAIALPIALQNLISFVVQLADTVMLGLAPGGETLLCASSLANQPFFILSIACFGFSGAATVLSAQYYGKKDYASVRVIFSIVLKAVIIVSLVLGFAALLIPEQVMRLYTADGAVIKHGAEYLRILGYAYFTFGFSNTLVCCLRSVDCKNLGDCKSRVAGNKRISQLGSDFRESRRARARHTGRGHRDADRPAA